MDQANSSVPLPGQRVVSIDVLRGFDMFWILGMEEVAVEIAKASGAAGLRQTVGTSCRLSHYFVGGGGVGAA